MSCMQDILVLVLSACQTYINSFTMQSKTTDRLELAQSCLLVIGKQDPFICDKLDIINGVLFLRSHSCVDISLHGKINCNI